MSDVPELDRLIEEVDIVRRNTEWDRHDRFFRRSMGSVLVSMLSIPVLALLFGQVGVVISMVLVLLSSLPVLVTTIYVLLGACFIDPPRRDPTKRYKRM